MTPRVHTIPVNDLAEHDTDGLDCVCGPSVVDVPMADGGIGQGVVHRAFDRRELSEPDYQPRPSQGAPA